MRIAYNPLYKPDGKTKVGALKSAPINDIVFDLPGKSIWAKGLKFLGTDSLKIIIGSSSDTVAGTWTGQHSEIGRYEDGLTIIYIPKVAGASTTTLNINGLGAKTCYFTGTSKLTTHYPAGTPILFTYYNDGWRRADYNSNTNYYRPIEVNDSSLLGNNNYVLNFKSDGNISYTTTAATSTSKQADLTIGINILNLKNNLGVSTIINNASTNDLLPTSKSVYDFVGTYLASYMHWKGNTPSSGTTFTIPNVAVVGDAYRIAVAGTIPAANSITGSAQIVEVGDIIICTDTTGPKYTVAQTNWTTVAGTSVLAWNSEVTLATIGGLAIKAKLPTNPTLALKSISFTKADGTAVSYNGSTAVDLTGGINYATLANLVRSNLIIKWGDTEGTNLFTYNGSSAKTIDLSIPFSLLFTNFSNIGSLTTRITIGGVTKDLKIDADTLDGQHLMTQVSNWNTDSLSIFKSSENSISNAPTTDFTYGVTLRFHRDVSTYHTDLVTSLYYDKLFFRRKTEEGYKTWREIIHSGNYASYLDSRYYTKTESDDRFVNVTGDTMTGLLTTTSSNHGGVKIGNTYITAINGELIFQNNLAIRFGGDSWDYNVWAGLKYVHSSKIIYLGLADNSAFTANSAQSGGKLYLPGITNIYTGNGTNLVWHAGNDGSGSGLDADMTDGLHVHTGRNNEANKIVRTDGSGYIQAGWINTTSGDMGTTTATRVYCSNDAYIRYKTLANFSSDIAGQLYWANIKVSTASNTTTYPIFGSLAVINDSCNNSNNSLVYFQHRSNNDWTVKIDSGNYDYGLHINGSQTATNALSVTGGSRFTNTIRIGNGSTALNGNYCEGIRIGAADNTWATIILGTTADTGTNTYAWSIHRTSGNNFSISRNSSDGANGLLIDTSGRIGIGTTSPSERLSVNGWVGTIGNNGWYNITYGGGWHMTDTTYIRVYGSKRVYNDNTSQYAFYTSGGMTAFGHMWSSSSAQSWLDGQRAETAALNIAASNDTGSYWPWFRQTLTAANKWISVGTLSNSLYFIGSATSRTDNGYDYGFVMDFRDGTFSSPGNIYAPHFYENSDIRYKKVLKNLSINSNIIANLPLFDFEWIENNTIGTGTSAQSVQEILPNIVSGTDKLTLDYGVLGTIAGITACKELVAQKSEIDLLKERIELLEQQLKMYHGNSK